jgi:divalent metal cation (Fe/Co/Zn/Cd) transporter
MTLVTVRWSLKPPSDRFPSGYGKIESLGSLGVSGMLLAGGFMMGWSALIVLCQQFFPQATAIVAHWGLLPHSHGHHHDVESLGLNTNAIWLAAASIVIKEWLYQASTYTDFKFKSSSVDRISTQLSKLPGNESQLSSLQMPTIIDSTLSQPLSPSF